MTPRSFAIRRGRNGLARKRPETRQAWTHAVDPVLPVIRTRRHSLLRERRNLHHVEDLHRLRRCSRRAVVGQRRPRGDQTVVGRNGIVLPTAILAGKSTGVLPMSTPSDHGVDMQRVDLPRSGTARPRRRLLLAEQDHHGGRVGWVVGGERDPAGVAPSRASSQNSPTLVDHPAAAALPVRTPGLHQSPVRARTGGAPELAHDHPALRPVAQCSTSLSISQPRGEADPSCGARRVYSASTGRRCDEPPIAGFERCRA